MYEQNQLQVIENICTTISVAFTMADITSWSLHLISPPSQSQFFLNSVSWAANIKEYKFL